MTLQNHSQSDPAPNTESAEELEKLGITRRTIDYFYFGNYRYTDLNDAIAQARRQGSVR